MRLDASFVFRGLVLAGLVLLATAPAQAAVELRLQILADGVQIGDVDQSHLGCVDNPDGVSAVCSANNLEYSGDYPLLNIDTINLEIDSDPTVSGSMSVTNLDTINTQLFTFIFTLPVSPIASPVTGGSARGTVTDTNGNGATISNLGGSLYTALLDGVDWQSLHTGVSYSDTSSPGPTSFTSLSFGSPIPSLPGPGPVTTSIGIRLEFKLTPGDQASITSNHVVVPEPHTAGLMALGLGFLAKKRRN